MHLSLKHVHSVFTVYWCSHLLHRRALVRALYCTVLYEYSTFSQKTWHRPEGHPFVMKWMASKKLKRVLPCTSSGYFIFSRVQCRAEVTRCICTTACNNSTRPLHSTRHDALPSGRAQRFSKLWDNRFTCAQYSTLQCTVQVLYNITVRFTVGVQYIL